MKLKVRNKEIKARTIQECHIGAMRNQNFTVRGKCKENKKGNRRKDKNKSIRVSDHPLLKK